VSVITDGIDDASPTCGGGTPRIDRGNIMYVSIAIKLISPAIRGAMEEKQDLRTRYPWLFRCNVAERLCTTREGDMMLAGQQSEALVTK